MIRCQNERVAPGLRGRGSLNQPRLEAGEPHPPDLSTGSSPPSTPPPAPCSLTPRDLVLGITMVQQVVGLMPRTDGVRESPLVAEERDLRVVVVGAGMAGILSLIKLREAGLTDVIA